MTAIREHLALSRSPSHSGSDLATWRSATVPRWTVVPLRLYLGSAFFLETIGRLSSWSGWEAEVRGFLSAYQSFATPGYQSFMTQVALPHASLFAILVFAGEAFVALSFLLGAATRVGAGVGMFLSLNYLLSKGNTPWSVNNDFAFIAGMAVVALTRAGRTAGLDKKIAQRWPRSWLG